MRDFTYTIYREMLEAAISQGYHLAAYEDFVTGKTAGHKKSSYCVMMPTECRRIPCVWHRLNLI